VVTTNANTAYGISELNNSFPDYYYYFDGATSYTATGTLTITKATAAADPIGPVTFNLVDANGNPLGTPQTMSCDGTDTTNCWYNGTGTFTVSWTETYTITSNNYSGTKAPANNLAYIYLYDPTLNNGIKYVGNGTPEAIPTIPAKTLTAANGFYTINYMGAPFIIDGSQAQEVIEFIEQGDPNNTDPGLATDVAIGTTTLHILSEFTDNNASYSSLMAQPSYFDSCTGPKMLQNGLRVGGFPAATDHYVTMHQALVPFNANISRRISDVPPKIALVDTESNGDNTGSASVSGLLILDAYLANAGLYVGGSNKNVDSAGCPPNSLAGCTINGGKPGFIYDQFDADYDLIDLAGVDANMPGGGVFPDGGIYGGGVLNQLDSHGRNLYGVLWTPHWEATNSKKNYPSAVNVGGGAGKAGMDNIAAFLDKFGTGLMGECSSIDSYEGGGAIDVPNTHFLFSGPVKHNGLNKDDGSWEGINCTDPDYPNNVADACAATGKSGCSNKDNSNLKECVYWDNATNEFGQIGDFHFVQTSGVVDDIKPDTNSNYGSGTLRLATTWQNYNPGDYPNGGSGGACQASKTDCNNRWDIFVVGHKGGDGNKGQVVYVGGHDYQISTVGSRIILNTLLNLGADLVKGQRSLSAPLVYADPNGAFNAYGNHSTTLPQYLNFTGIYDEVSGVPNTYFTYTWATGSNWIFPQIPGDIFEAPLFQAIGSTSSLCTNCNASFASNSLWSAQGPGDLSHPSGLEGVYGGKANKRNLFTYFGGTIQAASNAPNGLLQQGWQPSMVAPEQVDDPNCVDVLKFGKVNDGKHSPTFGLIPGNDGVCDLEEATDLVALNAGTDFGASEWSTAVTGNQALLTNPANKNVVKGMLQVVEGYCFTTDQQKDGAGNYKRPGSTAECNAISNPNNYPNMGGIIHSTPAVVPPSANIQDTGAARPTVLYAAAADGQLHAFYISGGSGYKGPTATLHYPNTAASTVFGKGGLGTDWGGKTGAPFTPPLPMTELWSFMPASQLPLLAGNLQLVDSAPVVQDVFVDYIGSGIREWHTVVVATAGGPLGNPGSEIFALDVTNPVQPVLLWDLMGSWTWPSSLINPEMLANASSTATSPLILQTGNRQGFAGAGTSQSGIYDYSMLGASYGLSLGVVRAGDQPTFPVYVATNMSTDSANPGQNGVEVFSIDIATGQKIWQWVEPYSNAASASTGPGNPVPPPVSLLPDQNNSISWVYVPDYEGNLWELSARTGTNVWKGKGVANTGAIFSTGGGLNVKEPITSPIAIGRMPPTMSSTAGLKSWNNRIVAFAGTDNSDDSFVDSQGELHAINIDSFSRPSTGIAPSDPASSGFPILPKDPNTNAPERVVGNLTISGTTLFLDTADYPIHDIEGVDITSNGNTFAIPFDALGNGTSLSSLQAPYFSGHPIFGGVATVTTASGQFVAVGAQTGQLALISSPPPALTSGEVKANPALSVNNPSNGVLYHVAGWMRRVLQ
jgi:type IV pilus assembly protein PilY1